MTEYEQILEEMDKVLDQLIEVAEKMKDLSKQVFVESEMISFQKKEQDLIDKLIDLDGDYQQASKNISPQTIKVFQEKIETKLKEFQHLNIKFIDNISESRGVLQFPTFKEIRPPNS
jgi:predicted  nucleic acid-binding Zn-ribbon protein